MPTVDQITNWTPIDTVATQAAAGGSNPAAVARHVLDALVGRDDEPGPLDRYEIRAYQVGDDKPMVFWFCPRTHSDGNDAGHLGVIARDMDGDQTGLTLGEILAAVLDHEREEHDGPAV